MSEGQSTYENKVNPDTINAEYLRSIGPDKQKVAQAEFKSSRASTRSKRERT